jgi:hypothetical protein
MNIGTYLNVRKREDKIKVLRFRKTLVLWWHKYEFPRFSHLNVIPWICLYNFHSSVYSVWAGRLTVLELYMCVCVCVCVCVKSRHSSVGIALGYGLDYRGSSVRFPAGAENFPLHHRVQNGSGAHPASYPIGTRGCIPGGKAAGAWSWPLTSI